MTTKNGLLNGLLMIPIIILIIFILVSQQDVRKQFKTLESHDLYLLEKINTVENDIESLEFETNIIRVDLTLLDQQNDDIKRRIEDLKLSIQNIDSVDAMSHIGEIWRELELIRKVIGD